MEMGWQRLGRLHPGAGGKGDTVGFTSEHRCGMDSAPSCKVLQGWFSLVEEVDMRPLALLRTKQPKQAKSSDKEGSKAMNVAFLPREMCHELAVLNRHRDFKARRGCGIIWLDSCITSREFPPVPPQTDQTGQQGENQGV